jgi:hypothetical protein
LRGDALLALGRLGPLLDQSQAPAPWQTLWQAYRCHGLALAGQEARAWEVARGLVPVDVYEWVHVFECLLRLGRLDALDLGSVLFRPPGAEEHRWAALARRRMRADYLRVRGQQGTAEVDLAGEYAGLAEAYDRAGLPFERALVRLGWSRLLHIRGDATQAQRIAGEARELGLRYGMPVIAADACELLGPDGRPERDRLRSQAGYAGPSRP